MEADQSRNGQEESFLRGAAKAAAFGALLGAAVGAVTAASREAAEQDPESHEAAPQDEAEEREEPERQNEAEQEEDPMAEVDEAETEPQAEVEEQEGQEPQREAEEDGEPERSAPDDEAEEPRANGSAGPAGLEVVRRARSQLAELIGRTPEGVLGFERTDDGWRITLEVVEMPRVPSSTDVLGAYDVHVDESGDVQQWRRTGRYIRSRAEPEGMA